MAISTAGDIINLALQRALGLNPGETPSTTQSSQALDILNVMLDTWNTKGFLTGVPVRESFTLTANKKTYTVGASGCDITTAYPLVIDSAFVRDTANNTDSDVAIITREQYDSLTDKDITSNTGTPTMLFYDPGTLQESVQAGTIYLYPIPDSSTTYSMFIESEKAAIVFASTSTSINLPTGYKAALINNLAVILCDYYGKNPTQALAYDAKDSMDAVISINSKNRKVVASLSIPTSKTGSLNILTGQAA